MPDTLFLFFKSASVSQSTGETKEASCTETIHSLQPFRYRDKDLPQIVQELSDYICSSFGDKTRIDYGSGHELNFICFLYCLVRLECFSFTDYSDLVNMVFAR
jgi:hypothetical protein